MNDVQLPELPPSVGTERDLLVVVPLGQRRNVEAILKAAGVNYTHDRGFWLRKFTVAGSPEALSALQPRLDDWSREYLSQDAW